MFRAIILSALAAVSLSISPAFAQGYTNAKCEDPETVAWIEEAHRTALFEKDDVRLSAVASPGRLRFVKTVSASRDKLVCSAKSHFRQAGETFDQRLKITITRQGDGAYFRFQPYY